ncbi:S1C family serine protease [Methylovirgula sp. HY1]|uniref:S1C family serine protease n=1 Tax=Methylovirgula sp. HY1 TaxID=2822761 RepID=UPI001C5BE506|nr:S1C family serine protease [Methylovirgula sp. HY1]QXX73378.1 Serine protease Do-like HtrB [Methylovirgula sp. HY1]
MAVDEDDWDVPLDVQPKPGDYGFDLDHALDAVVALTARIPADAHTADTLGTERAGNAVVIGPENLLLTIGYLVVEANEIWLTTGSGRVVAAHMVGYDYATGFGLIQAQGPLDCPILALGDSRLARPGERGVVAGAGGRRGSVAAHIVARRQFAGYWEYVLDNAIYTAPAHPQWGGAALIGPAGDLWGIGSLQVPHQLHGEQVVPLNMSVPIETLLPILEDLKTLGRVNQPARPWLGLFAAEAMGGGVVIVGLAGEGPARRAGLREGDTVLSVAGREVSRLADFFQAVWSLGEAGVEVPLRLDREGDVFDMRLTSADRYRFLKKASLH